MSKRWLALAGTALALVLVAATFDTAEAGRRGGGFHARGGGHFSGRSFGGGSHFVGRPHFYRGGHSGHRHYGHRHYGHRHYGHRHHAHRHFRRGFVIGAPLAFGAYYYGYGSCRWLRYRALETGSGYWWSRYHDCINGYY